MITLTVIQNNNTDYHFLHIFLLLRPQNLFPGGRPRRVNIDSQPSEISLGLPSRYRNTCKSDYFQTSTELGDKEDKRK